MDVDQLSILCSMAYVQQWFSDDSCITINYKIVNYYTILPSWSSQSRRDFSPSQRQAQGAKAQCNREYNDQ